MKFVLKCFLVLSLAHLAACSADSDTPDKWTPEGGGSKPEAIKEQALQGGINGVPWVIYNAVGVIQSNGTLLVSIAGSGDYVNCTYTVPAKPGLLFTIPLAVAEHDFDLNAPHKGYPVTWMYYSTSGIQNVISDMVHISVKSISSTRVIAGLSAKFLDLSNRGTFNGKFEITICR